MLTSATHPATALEPRPARAVEAAVPFRSGLAFYGVAARLLDVVVILLSLTLAQQIRMSVDIGKAIPPSAPELPSFVALILVVIWLAASSRLGLYRIDRSIYFRSQCVRATSVSLAVAALFAGALYLTSRDVSRLLFLYFFLISTSGLILVRYVLTVTLRWAIPVEQRVALIGTGPVARTLAHSLRRSRWGSIPRTRLVGFVAAGEVDDADSDVWREPEPIITTSTEAPDLLRIARDYQLDEVVLALSPDHGLHSAEVLTQLRESGVGVRLVPDVMEFAATQARVEHIDGIPVIYLRDPALQAVEQAAKRSLDVTLSALILIMLAPVLALIALGVRLDSPGPILFRATRVGRGGRTFTMYKFRTMRDGAPPPETQTTASPVDTVFKKPDDPRVTRLGKLLRRTSVDELPQLVNVLRGDMSLVGPRPEQPFIVQAYRPWQRRRLEVRPGITGWWQVQGRDLPMHWHTDYDLYYIYNYSLALDLKILARTVWAVLHGRGAY